MDTSRTRVILIGVGCAFFHLHVFVPTEYKHRGATCSGKTTLAKHLRSILPGSFIIHQDVSILVFFEKPVKLISIKDFAPVSWVFYAIFNSVFSLAASRTHSDPLCLQSARLGQRTYCNRLEQTFEFY